MKLKDVVKILKSKPQEQEVNFIVVNKDGAIVAMELQGRNIDITKIHELFSKLGN